MPYYIAVVSIFFPLSLYYSYIPSNERNVQARRRQRSRSRSRAAALADQIPERRVCNKGGGCTSREKGNMGLRAKGKENGDYYSILAVYRIMYIYIYIYIHMYRGYIMSFHSQCSRTCHCASITQFGGWAHRASDSTADVLRPISTPLAAMQNDEAGRYGGLGKCQHGTVLLQEKGPKTRYRERVGVRLDHACLGHCPGPLLRERVEQ